MALSLSFLNRKGDKKEERHERIARLLTDECSFGYTEAFRTLRTNLKYVLDSTENGHIVMVTSSVPAEGKSNVSINLSIALARDNHKVILLDCDLRKATLIRYLKVSRRHAGIVEVLRGEETLEKAVVGLKKEGISFLPAGMIVDNPTELLGSGEMHKLIKRLEKEYDYVILDTPPVNAVADASVLSRYADGCVMVVSHNQVTRDNVQAAKQQLDKTNTRILGVVLNMYDARNAGTDNTKYYSYYNSDYNNKYGYGSYGYGEREKIAAMDEADDEEA
ncbi:MAG: CpsD/CapB family tyrosine-protein kinase [Lachnospiraceae bacterium]|nr:CpsD/CapB family tyrosine-protein kinase [Lachnospiraceae bacterium]